jgi:mersacidin/lichenicidin family type 2 lantibiotic
MSRFQRQYTAGYGIPAGTDRRKCVASAQRGRQKKGITAMGLDVVRAWKDEAYRESLSEEERKQLLQNPVGELTDDDLQSVYGGIGANVQAYTFVLNGDQLCPAMAALKKLKYAKKNAHVNVKLNLNLDQMLNTVNSQLDNFPDISAANP